MNTQNKPRLIAYGLTLTSLCALTFASWGHIAPAHAQDDPNTPRPQQPGGGGGFPSGGGGGQGRRNFPGGGGFFPGGGQASLAATTDSVYVLRGNTLYKMRANDLSIVSQKDLPAPAGGMGGPGGGGGFGGRGGGNGFGGGGAGGNGGAPPPPVDGDGN